MKYLINSGNIQRFGFTATCVNHLGFFFKENGTPYLFLNVENI